MWCTRSHRAKIGSEVAVGVGGTVWQGGRCVVAIIHADASKAVRTAGAPGSAGVELAKINAAAEPVLAPAAAIGVKPAQGAPVAFRGVVVGRAAV